MHGIMCLLCLCCGVVAYAEDRTLVSLSNMCAFGWNAITCLANFMIHAEWKQVYESQKQNEERTAGSVSDGSTCQTTVS